MASFAYKGLKKDGAPVEGRISATDQPGAISQLRAQGILAYEVRAVDGEGRRFDRRRARPKDRHRFIRQLATLLRAGSPLLASFDSLLEEEPCRELNEQMRAIRSDLRGGGRLSQALTRHMPELPDYAPRLVELGEATGSLDARLNEVAAQMERDLASVEEVRNALAYPAFLAVAGVGAVIFIFMFVVPRFSALMDNAQAEIPAISRIVLGIGQFFNANMPLVLGGAVVLIILAVQVWRTPAMRRAATAIAFRTPVLGRFLEASDTARWARVTGTALSAGAGLIDALALAERGVLSPRRREGLEQVRRAVRSGEMLEVALRAHTTTDAMTLNLVRTGRLSGALAEMLIFVAEAGEQDARNLAKRLTSMAEPLAIAFIASIIGLIVISLVLAMSSLYSFDIT
ncbi:type II secretion system F family protein [Maricaulis sp.]|uniref:type II secretion system F family protein n=1 Tax=Maricaulis sp. TaxID=1486257 RepID=UPI002622150C|nr:type II secretion system F family protein [Maricaulis sp.]